MPSHSRGQTKPSGIIARPSRLDRLEGPRARVHVASDAPARTLALGTLLGSLVPPGSVLSLEGGLGAGKTLLAKGLCAGLGVPDEVLSPSFILVEEYRGIVPVFHFDLYRLDKVGEVAAIGLFDAVDGRAVVIVEWGDRLPPGTLDIDVRIVMTITGPERRDVTVEGCQAIITALEKGMR